MWASGYQKGTTLEQLLKRSDVDYANLADLDTVSRETSTAVREQVEIQVKYKGYMIVRLSR
jgi:tRNA uridine 5-carboxymethylaminomethyl modification enzyme